MNAVTEGDVAADVTAEVRFDAIFDGNFSSAANDPFLEKLFHAHPEENYLFYLDASLPETLKRHALKAGPRIPAEKMREVIPEGSSLKQTVEQSRSFR